MKTLKDLKAAVAKATHMKLVSTDKPHKYVGVLRKIHHSNTVGFALANPNTGEPSYLRWPEKKNVIFHIAKPWMFTVLTGYDSLTYELITEVPA